MTAFAEPLGRASGSIDAFEARYADLRRRTKRVWLIGAVIFAALFLIILTTVILIDFGSEKLRHRIIGLERGPA